jgi:Na+-translocating ferredoxin:NAD+ oxidoreductase RnfG subunit
MIEFLSRFNGGELIALTSVIMGPVMIAIIVVASQWRKVRVAELEVILKQQMVDKGMSAAEIEQVMKASNDPGEVSVTSTGNEAQDKAALVQRMVDQGYEGEDIERVLKAYQPAAKKPEDKPVANQV